MNWKEKLITDVMKNIAWHLLTQILVTHRVFLLIIIQVVAREKHGIRKHPAHKPEKNMGSEDIPVTSTGNRRHPGHKPEKNMGSEDIPVTNPRKTWDQKTSRSQAREKHGIRRHPGYKPDYYIIEPYAEKLHNKIINKVIYHELPEQERSEFQINLKIL
jgi:hypothetical protein